MNRATKYIFSHSSPTMYLHFAISGMLDKNLTDVTKVLLIFSFGGWSYGDDTNS